VWTGFVKGALFVPVISSLVLVGIVWRIIYTPDTGIANIFLKVLGLPSLNWLGDTKLAMPSVILVSIWKSVGYFMVLYIAAIMDIPAHYYEAAKVDGANAWQRFWHITLPLLKPATLFVVVLGTIWAFQVFDLVYTLTGGGPGFSTTTLVMHVYNSAFRQFQMGYGTTVAYVLFLIVIVISLIQMKFLKSDEAIY
jgi:multiple sugar transport system permease protein